MKSLVQGRRAGGCGGRVGAWAACTQTQALYLCAAPGPMMVFSPWSVQPLAGYEVPFIESSPAFEKLRRQRIEKADYMGV